MHHQKIKVGQHLLVSRHLRMLERSPLPEHQVVRLAAAVFLQSRRLQAAGKYIYIEMKTIVQYLIHLIDKLTWSCFLSCYYGYLWVHNFWFSLTCLRNYGQYRNGNFCKRRLISKVISGCLCEILNGGNKTITDFFPMFANGQLAAFWMIYFGKSVAVIVSRLLICLRSLNLAVITTDAYWTLTGVDNFAFLYILKKL